MADGNFQRRLEPSACVLFISLLQITNRREDLGGTPTGFLLPNTQGGPHVGHRPAGPPAGLHPDVARRGLPRSRTTARQEVKSSPRSRPTIAQPSPAASPTDPAYQLLTASCLRAEGKGEDFSCFSPKDGSLSNIGFSQKVLLVFRWG